MRIDRKITILPIILFSVLLLSGCLSDQQAMDVNAQPDYLETRQGDSMAKRFQESAIQNPTALESAIELSEKYARLSEESVLIRQQNQEFVARNQQLQNQVVSLEAQLQQTQKELTQANDLLIEMRVELNNWKTNILGFRDEMRNAETAQLEALLKILKVLGGQLATESAKEPGTDSAVAKLNEPGRP